MAFSGAHPAFIGQHDSDRIGRQQFCFTEGFGFTTNHNRRAALITVLLGIGGDFFLNQGFQSTLRAQCFLEEITLFFQFILLTANLHFLKLGQMAQF